MNSSIFNESYQQTLHLVDKRYLKSALKDLLQLGNKINENSTFLLYQIGVIYWHLLGDGANARKYFILVCEQNESHPDLGNQQNDVIYSNALENAMLCSLSFDEFFSYGQKLKAIKPDMPIVKELIPKVEELMHNGLTWIQVMFILANSYYHRTDPRQDAGRYGEARATYHLALLNRKILQAGKDDWRYAVNELCRLSARIVSDYCLTQKEHGDVELEEYLSIINEAISLLCDYLASQPTDALMLELKSNLQDQVRYMIGEALIKKPLPSFGYNQFGKMNKVGCLKRVIGAGFFLIIILLQLLCY